MTKLKGIAPILETSNLKESIKYYETTLGFVCQGVWPETGDVCWASMRRDDAVIMLCIRNPKSKLEKPAFSGTLYLYPGDVDEAWAELKDKANISYEIETFDYGMREFGVIDPDGYLLQFGQEVDCAD